MPKGKKSKNLEILCAVKNGSLFVKIFKCIKELSPDIILKFDPDGMVFQGMDTSHISMSYLNWKKDDFDIYNVTSTLQFGISVENLNKVLKLLPHNGAVQLGYYPEKNDSLNIVMLNDKDTEFDVDLNLMDLELEELTIPELEYKVHLKYSSLEFKNVIRDVKEFSDVITFDIDNDDVTIVVDGELGKAECKLKHDSVEPILCSINVRLALRFVSLFSEFQICSDIVEIKLAEDMPICFIFSFGTMSSMMFFLAPKFNDDE